jgi:hypothetical protein
LADQKAALFQTHAQVLPNPWHPSDHLPVVAAFELV